MRDTRRWRKEEAWDMQTKGVGILLYFDNFHRIEALPDEQLGLLLRALMECGEMELRGEDGITGFEKRYPQMWSETRMAFLFMADNVRRETAARMVKHANYSAAARRRAEQQRRSAGPAGQRPGEAGEPEEPDDGPIVPPPPAVREQLQALLGKMRMEGS